ncbi:D-alanyl-D-alanine carboxypeptidase family protein [Paenisporosarcina sp. TG-14]|uniref:D-alanyl-D-alanine carboxypeptidase family protein n=1 Tax=Paenisporosarcina sp. TG-14 TaxID=1231057 RepID=UPI0002D62799|nr:D-alanyl-D-alanine carboxypeptidase family protein [Paenisporosarcina sp. TG-14]
MDFKKLAIRIGISTAVMTLGLTLLPATDSFTPTYVGSIQVEAATVKYSTTVNLNIRSGASTKHKILTTIPKGKQVTYVSKSGSWSKVKYDSRTGYVSTKYLKKVATATVNYVTTDNLNMRSGASTKYKVLVTIPRGKSVSYVSKSGSWYKVKYGSKTGFVNSSYLKKAGPNPTVYLAPSTKTPGKYVSGVLFVNKKYSLPSTYNPGISLPAQKGVNDMVADAKKAGVILKTISTFRTYSYQNTLYNNYVKKHGKAKADRFSARPGYSEHQTGLAFDFGGANQSHWLKESFAGTKEGQWLSANVHKYGFVLRYPKGKENITGYMYEPWHFRYIGSAMATKVKSSGKTLEEYFNVAGK